MRMVSEYGRLPKTGTDNLHFRLARPPKGASGATCGAVQTTSLHPWLPWYSCMKRLFGPNKMLKTSSTVASHFALEIGTVPRSILSEKITDKGGKTCDQFVVSLAASVAKAALASPLYSSRCTPKSSASLPPSPSPLRKSLSGAFIAQLSLPLALSTPEPTVLAPASSVDPNVLAADPADDAAVSANCVTAPIAFCRLKIGFAFRTASAYVQDFDGTFDVSTAPRWPLRSAVSEITMYFPLVVLMLNMKTSWSIPPLTVSKKNLCKTTSAFLRWSMTGSVATKALLGWLSFRIKYVFVPSIRCKIHL
mmetsp:Transcript_38652/g.70351  ORF Transcript_38652/g.70351 Transcript_38652/m.70351 type:complete len:307 (-) Transcript_38652:263-1183(-)